MTSKRRQNRRRRRKDRQENAERQNGLYTTTTLFVVAALFISMARVMFKVSNSAFVPSLDMALTGLLLMFFGMFSVWGIVVNRRKILVGVLYASIGFGAFAWFGANYIPLSKTAAIELAKHPSNPRDINLPRLTNFRGWKTLDETEDAPAPLLSISAQDAWLGQTMVESTSDFETQLKIFREREKQQVMLGQEPDPEPLFIAADKCTPFDLVYEFIEPNDHPKGFKAILWGSGALRYTRFHMLTRVVDDEDFIEEDRASLVLLLTKDGIDIVIDGERIPSKTGCPIDGPTICTSSKPKKDCEPGWNGEAFREVLAETSNQSHCGIFFDVVVSPDVPFQQLLSLITLAESTKRPPGQRYSSCYRDANVVHRDDYKATPAPETE